MIATAALAAVSVGVSVAGGIAKNKEGRKMQQEAQKKLDSFKWDDLKNAYENVQLSTVGTDLRREEQARSSAGIVDALQSSGTRAILAGAPSVQYNDNIVNQQIAADLDQQEKNRQMGIAQDNVNIRNARMQQQGAELQGYGQLYSVGMETKYSGLSDIASGIGAASQAVGAYGNQLGKNTPSDGSAPANLKQFDFSTPQMQGQNLQTLAGNSSNFLPANYARVYGGDIYGGMNYGMGGNFKF